MIVTPLKTLSYASGRPEIVEGDEMKNVEDCLEEIQDGLHGKYPYTIAMTEYMDADDVEGRLRSIAQAVAAGNMADFRIYAESLGYAINACMQERAEFLSRQSVTPFDNDTNESDVRREQ